MPTPDRTSLDAIIAAGRDILRSDGLPGLTMQAVAQRVGVRAPSLYKRVRGRDDLLRLVVEASLHDLDVRVDAALAAGGGAGDGGGGVGEAGMPEVGVPDASVRGASVRDAGADLIELARTMRAFARENPAEYRLIFAEVPDAAQASALERSSAAVLAVAERLAGPRDALPAARTITAWANGFISMELAGAFRLGGDVDEAFEYGARRLAAALAA